jgi:hypothetical protein
VGIWRSAPEKTKALPHLVWRPDGEAVVKKGGDESFRCGVIPHALIP